ncbi:MAG: DUF2752 domain-containing protein [Nanoarchaeota archaeon]|nr:DUF2752 domain-containing protein [Nanoarchaeota archaeon]
MGGKLKEISSRVLTFSYPRYRFFTFFIILILLALVPIEVLEKAPNLSICSKVLGEYCFSVGITRGVSSLLKGAFSQGMNYNFLSLIVLSVLILFILHDFSVLIKDKN